MAGMARRDQPRWPGGTPIRPDGGGPGGGRFREVGAGGSGGMLSRWAQRISDAIGHRRGEAPATGPAQSHGPDPAAVRRRYGLPPEASNEELGQAIRRASTGSYVLDQHGVYQPPGYRLDQELADLTRHQQAAEMNAAKKEIITTYVDDLFELAEEIQNGVFQHDFEVDPDMESLINEMADVVMDRPDNWSALRHASENLRDYITQNRYVPADRLPRRPPETTWTRG